MSDLGWFYLSLEGRIGRRDYWLLFMLPSLLLFLGLGFMRSFEESALDLALAVILIWPSIAVQAKRWHDRDLSGWWILVCFIPAIGWLIALVMNGFLPGTRGENRYGPDPLAGSTD